MSAVLREYLLLVQESAYKTAVSSPTVWTTSTTYGLANYGATYIRLDGGNSFTARARPTIVTTPVGGGLAIDAYAVSDKIPITGTLTTKLCVGQAPMLLSWAGVRSNGSTTPWSSTEPAGDLLSCSAYHYILAPSGTPKQLQYTGGKVNSWSVAVSEASTVATLTLNLTFSDFLGNTFDSTSDPTIAAPADNNFPVDPYLFIHLASGATIGGTSRSQITDLTVSSTNTFAQRFFTNRFLQMMHLTGRATTTAAKIAYSLSPDDRTHYYQVASETCDIALNNGTHSVTFQQNAQNYYDPFEDDLPLNDLYMQGFTSKNMWDASAGADMSITFT